MRPFTSCLDEEKLKMSKFNLVIVMCLCSLINNCTCVLYRKGNKTVTCEDLNQEVLGRILGAAFNSRYMSVEKPPAEEEVVSSNVGNGKRRTNTNFVPSFYVDDDYYSEIADEPAWSVDHVRLAPWTSFGHDRKKRAAKRPMQWECESKIHWVDLGQNYFPRYLRTIQCTSTSCWYGHYSCKPRSFTVKLLRRKVGKCNISQVNAKIGIDGLPADLRQLWVWEERAVNFCCDCAV